MDPMMKAEKSANATNDAAADETSARLAGLPRTPIPPMKFNLLAKSLNDALDTLSGGAAGITVAETDQPVAEFPREAALGVTALKLAFDKVPEGEAYRFSLDQLGDEAGVGNLSKTLYDASKDTKLIRALTKPAPVAFTPNSQGGTQLGKDKKPRDASMYEDKMAFTPPNADDNRKTT